RDRFLHGLRQAIENGNHGAAVAILQGLACCAAEWGEPECCLELLGSAQTCVRTAGLKEFVAPTTPATMAERMSRVTLGEHAASRAWERGLHMEPCVLLHRLT